MNKYAIIQDQKVVNVILLNDGVNTGSFIDSTQIAKLIDNNTKTSVGMSYSTSSNTFLNPLAITDVVYSDGREYLDFAPDLLECYITSSISLEVYFNREIDTSSFTNDDLVTSSNVTLENWNYPNNFTASFEITPTVGAEEGSEVSIRLSEDHEIIDTLGFKTNRLMNNVTGETNSIYLSYYSSSI